MNIVEYIIMGMLPYFVIGFMILWLAKRVLNFRVSEKYDGPEEVINNNIAVGLRRTGFLVGIGIAMSGVLEAESQNLFEGMYLSVLFGLLVILFQLLALWSNDTFILPGINNNEALKKENLAVGIVEAGSMVATGFVAKASMTGEGNFISAIVFFLLAQIAMLLAIRVYEVLKSDLNIVKEVESGNIAAAILLGGKLTAYGILMMAAVSVDFSHWASDLTIFAVAAVSGFIFLFVSEFIIDKMLVPGKTIHEMIKEENVACVLVVAGGKIAMSAIISTLVI